MRKRFTVFMVLFALTAALNGIMPLRALAQKFIHPGIDQTAQGLAHMKSLVLKGKQPYKDAFTRRKAQTDLNFVVKPHTHVLRGPYGNPNISRNDLVESAQMAYNCAVVRHITMINSGSSNVGFSNSVG
jgi:hypothetical protein